MLERFGQAGSSLLSRELESYEQAGLELSHLGHSHVTRSCDKGRTNPGSQIQLSECWVCACVNTLFQSSLDKETVYGFICLN